MPIFMDRHDLPESVTAEEVARLHQEDLKVEDDFGCKGLTYWFDEQRKTAFCLVNAPNRQALVDMHNHAHGAVPNSIVEVDPNIVESFLGRIEDPVKAKNKDLNIINDPAFKVLMIIELKNYNLSGVSQPAYQENLRNFQNKIYDLVAQYKGRSVQSIAHNYLFSFDSVTHALNCSLAIKRNFEASMANGPMRDTRLHVGLSSGVPFEQEEGLFNSAIKVAENLCNFVYGEIVTTSEVKNLYESENRNISIEDSLVRSLRPSDEKFLSELMTYIECSWCQTDLKVEDFSFNLGLSKAQLYRKVKSITGKSLNTLLKHYRLENALELLRKNRGNISEIAFDSGFNSPAYFSKCFYSKYGILPSELIK